MERIVFVSVSILLCGILATVDGQIYYVYKICNGNDFNYTDGSVYQKNIGLLFAKLIPKSSSLKFYNATAGSAPNQVYSFYQCRNDVPLSICDDCVKAATQKIVADCPLTGEAVLWYYECTLWYANKNMYSVHETYSARLVWNTNNISNSAEFVPILKSTLMELNDNASSLEVHSARNESNWANSGRLYSYAQCTPDMDQVGCIGCLKIGFAQLVNCCSVSTSAAFFAPSCQLRFDTTGSFLYTQSSPAEAPSNQGTNKKTSLKPAIIAAIAAGAAVGLLALSVVFWVCKGRRRHNKAIGYVKSDSEGLRDSEFTQYAFVTLKNATMDFSIENKLGEGGFGSVYKGTLENGELLAIKRLSATSGQGTTEFMTEARFLAKLQHKNLVKLVGFCLEGEEKLLVYEFMPNASLDRFLFDATRRPPLDWVTRYKIITGIARGLQYLHEDSRLTIIHRDLKPANILLDEKMNPKIADFGLAKLFDGAQTYGYASRIAGTPGYMAPEYKETGEYSDKSDVYSFGVMLLEIVSGLSNIKFYQSQKQEDLPVQAWRLWNEERLFDLADPAILDNCPSNVVMRCIQIGLLCLQANADDRPTMASVALMLTGSAELPVPSTPAMSFPHCNMPTNYSSEVQSSNGQLSTKSASIGTNTTKSSTNQDD